MKEKRCKICGTLLVRNEKTKRLRCPAVETHKYALDLPWPAEEKERA